MNDRSEQLKEALKQIEAMRLLTESEGWRIMDAWLAEQITARDGKLYGEAVCPEADYLRGEGGILRLIRRYPEMVLQGARTTVDLIRQEQADGKKRRGQRSPSSTGDEDTSGWTDED